MKKFVGVRLPDELRMAVEAHMAASGMKVTEVFIEALSAYVKMGKPVEKKPAKKKKLTAADVVKAVPDVKPASLLGQTPAFRTTKCPMCGLHLIPWGPSSMRCESCKRNW